MPIEWKTPGVLNIPSGDQLQLGGNDVYAAVESLRSTALTAAELAVLDGALVGDVVASKAVVSDASARIADADLILKSTNPATIMLGDVDGLQLDNAAIAAFAAATDTAGATAEMIGAAPRRSRIRTSACRRSISLRSCCSISLTNSPMRSRSNTVSSPEESSDIQVSAKRSHPA